MWPSVLFASIVISLLLYWTVSVDFGWYRREIDDITGETIGQCNGDSLWILTVLMLLLVIPIVLSAVMAYKTLGVDDLYSEGKWVLTFILVQFQVSVKGRQMLDRVAVSD